LQRPLPQQIEFSRLNLTYIVLSKRKLIQLVEEKHVTGWDDPRLPTLVGARRRGYPAEGFRLFAERIGALEVRFADRVRATRRHHARGAQRSAERRVAVLDPLRLIIDNYPEGQREECLAPNHPLKPEAGKRAMPFGRELWIEREDFMEQPSKGYHRLYPGNTARLRYGYVVKLHRLRARRERCGQRVHCEYLPDSKSGTPGADAYKVKGNLHWVAVADACLCRGAPLRPAVRRSLARRQARSDPEGAERDFRDDINPDSMRVIEAWLEPSLKNAARRALPVRTPWLLCRRRVDSKPGRAGVQPDGDAQGLLVGR
jgi:glutaminyl-tRNA synthetase